MGKSERSLTLTVLYCLKGIGLAGFYCWCIYPHV